MGNGAGARHAQPAHDGAWLRQPAALESRRCAVAFTARRDGRLELRSNAKDGTGASELFASFDDAVLDARPASWAPDGVTLAIDVASPDTGFDIGLLRVDPVDGNPPPWQPLIQTDDDEQKPAISPDGRWIAYQADYGGSSQIYVERFPDLGYRRQVSVGSSIHFNATWSRDGSALFYVRVSPLAVMRASVGADASGAPVVGTAEVQFTHGFFNSPVTYRTWDLAPDADRILMIVGAGDVLIGEQESRDQIIITQNWVEELRRLVAKVVDRPAGFCGTDIGDASRAHLSEIYCKRHRIGVGCSQRIPPHTGGPDGTPASRGIVAATPV